MFLLQRSIQKETEKFRSVLDFEWPKVAVESLLAKQFVPIDLFRSRNEWRIVVMLEVRLERLGTRVYL